MSSLYFYKNINSKFISIEGKDNKEFLQNIITNDIKLCTNESFLYSCLLSPQGKFSADFFIFKYHDNFIIETHDFFYEKLIKKLMLYKLRSNININKLENMKSFVVFGDIEKDNNLFIYSKDPRHNNIGNKLIHTSNTPTLLKGIKEIDENEYHEILIKNTVPLSHYDLEENKSLLLENNFENINSISWDKGCYIGQEITARMKYRALLKKRIYSLSLLNSSPNFLISSPKTQQILKEDEKELGKIISIKNKSILAMLKIELAEKKIKLKQPIITDDGLVLNFVI